MKVELAIVLVLSKLVKHPLAGVRIHLRVWELERYKGAVGEGKDIWSLESGHCVKCRDRKLGKLVSIYMLTLLLLGKELSLRSSIYFN